MHTYKITVPIKGTKTYLVRSEDLNGAFSEVEYHLLGAESIANVSKDDLASNFESIDNWDWEIIK